MPRLPVAIITFSIYATIAHANNYLLGCDSTRPSGDVDRAFRVLRVPRSALSNSSSHVLNANETEAARRLCCVYTRVRIVDSSSSSGARLQTYDRSSQSVAGATMEEMAVNALADVSEMGMGAQDIARQGACLACADDDAWRKRNSQTKGCGWVERNPTNRCAKMGADGTRASERCLTTCGCSSP